MSSNKKRSYKDMEDEYYTVYDEFRKRGRLTEIENKIRGDIISPPNSVKDIRSLGNSCISFAASPKTNYVMNIDVRNDRVNYRCTCNTFVKDNLICEHIQSLITYLISELINKYNDSKEIHQLFSAIDDLKIK